MKVNRIIITLQQKFKSDQHNMSTVKVKVALISGDDKRVQAFNCIKNYASGATFFFLKHHLRKHEYKIRLNKIH